MDRLRIQISDTVAPTARAKQRARFDRLCERVYDAGWRMSSVRLIREMAAFHDAFTNALEHARNNRIAFIKRYVDENGLIETDQEWQLLEKQLDEIYPYPNPKAYHSQSK